MAILVRFQTGSLKGRAFEVDVDPAVTLSAIAALQFAVRSRGGATVNRRPCAASGKAGNKEDQDGDDDDGSQLHSGLSFG